APGVRSSRDPMPDRVFDQMLQGEARHRRRQQVLVDVEDRTQTIREARLLNSQVLAHEIELLRQRDFGRAMTRQGPAQHVAELLDDPSRRLVAVADQHRDGVQRVEEEVRIELRLERLETGAGRLLRKTRQLNLSVTGLVEVANGVLRTDD